MKIQLVLLNFIFCFLLAAKNVLIEAETFPAAEHWNIGNAAAASGKKFLQAETKDASAKGRFSFPETGNYYIWVRNLSFSQNWRKSYVVVDGIRTLTVGDEKTTLDTPAWIWSRSKKPLYIQKGVHDVLLGAASASVRVDCILFTMDKHYVPRDGALPEEGTTDFLVPHEKDVLLGDLFLDVKTDKPALSYRCGEKIIFRITPVCDGKTLQSGKIVCRLRSDDGKDEIHEKTLSRQENGFTVGTTLTKPGFVRLTADLVDEDGKPVRGVAADGRVSFAHFDGGAGAEIEKIPSGTEPENFDDFWTKQKARLAAVPLRAETKLLEAYSDADYRTFAVTVDCAGNRPATGFLILPAGAKKGTLKAEIHFEGYGTGIPAVPGSDRRRDDAMVFFVNAHGSPLEASREEYAAFFAARKNYALSDNSDAQTCYFNGMVLRVLRGCEYLKNRPEWNGRDLEVVGGSQGGLQSLWAAAFDGKVSRCSIEVPWCCNMAGRTLHLMAPEWGIGKYEKALDYYDPVHLASRIRCPVVISRAGLGDYICPPSGIARLYYNLKSPKKITWIQNSNHGFAPENAERWTFQEP